MKPIHAVLVTLAALAATLVFLSTASADQPFDRCFDDPAVVPGPESCRVDPFTQQVFLPAGTRCDFDVTVASELSGTIYFFDNPPRAVFHILIVGTATGNGHTLTRTAHFTETASPPFVLTDHGLLTRYSLPGGRTVTIFAGNQRVSIDPPLPDVFHGNPPPSSDPNDAAAFCAALT